MAEKLNGPRAMGASPSPGKPVRWKKTRWRVCSSVTNCSGVLTGTSGTSSRRAAAITSALVRSRSASLAMMRQTSALARRKIGISHSGPESAVGVAEQLEKAAPLPRASGQHAHEAVRDLDHLIGAVGIARRAATGRMG